MIVERFNKINSKIKKLERKNINIVAVSKTFDLNHIMPLIEEGHLHYGENKVQEAESKWTKIKKERADLKLHMVGKLQSNKAKKGSNNEDKRTILPFPICQIEKPTIA